MVGLLSVADQMSPTSFDFAFYLTSEAQANVPLPAALPLFATVLAGGGLIAWRRKRKAAKLGSSISSRKQAVRADRPRNPGGRLFHDWASKLFQLDVLSPCWIADFLPNAACEIRKR